ncbi:MAG: TetR/AcrR family transcriptional regulator [bacterium]|nr:TetR/AcrR family transcriptional regulator [bacterium]
MSEDKKRGRRELKDSPEVKQDVFDAAVEVFARYGYGAAPVQKIADAAGVNKAMLYYYFGSKEELYNLIIDKGISALEGAVAAAESENAPLEERLRSFLTAYLSVVAAQPGLARIIYREVVGVGERARQTVADHFTGSIRRLADVLEQAQREGRLANVEASLSAYSLFGMANIFISSLMLTGRSLDIDTLVDHILNLFFNGAG